MRSPENEQLVNTMWGDNEREGLPDHEVVRTASSPDLAGLVHEAGLDRRPASEAYIALAA
jgi:hypothetical protein